MYVCKKIFQTKNISDKKYFEQKTFLTALPFHASVEKLTCLKINKF